MKQSTIAVGLFILLIIVVGVLFWSQGQVAQAPSVSSTASSTTEQPTTPVGGETISNVPAPTSPSVPSIPSAPANTPPSAPAPVAINPTPAIYSTSPTGNTIYTNPQFGFSVEYPSTIKVASAQPLQQNYSGFGIQSGVLAATSSTLLSTNQYVTGSLSISASADPSDVAQCMTPGNSESGPITGSNKTINGVTFLVYDSGSPGLGQFENDEIYKTLRGNVCYSIDATSGGVESSHLDSVHAPLAVADASQISSVLNAVVQTFKFTSSPAGAPTCSVSTDKKSYSLGDTIAVSWTSQNTSALSWKQPAHSVPITWLVSPSGTPAMSGSAKIVANVEGSQSLALNVLGSGGVGSCSAELTIAHSNVQTTLTISTVQQYTNTTGQRPEISYLIKINGTIANAALLNSSLSVYFVSPTYSGATDDITLEHYTNTQAAQTYPSDRAFFVIPVQSGATTWSGLAYDTLLAGTYKVFVTATGTTRPALISATDTLTK